MHAPIGPSGLTFGETTQTLGSGPVAAQAVLVLSTGKPVDVDREITKMADVTGDYVQMDQVGWVDFPQGLCQGDVKWKLLHVSPESGAWTAIFDCKAGSSFAKHIHMGPGEYFLTKGKMHVRGGSEEGGATAFAPGYGYEACNAQHDHTEFPEDSEFYMTFLGPLNFIDDDGNTIALVGWRQVYDAWQASQAA